MQRLEPSGEFNSIGPACLAKKCLNVTRQLLAAVAPTGKWLDEQAAELVGRAHHTWLLGWLLCCEGRDSFTPQMRLFGSGGSLPEGRMTPTGRSGRSARRRALLPPTNRTDIALALSLPGFSAKGGIPLLLCGRTNTLINDFLRDSFFFWADFSVLLYDYPWLSYERGPGQTIGPKGG